jgi:hypothetical protein
MIELCSLHLHSVSVSFECDIANLVLGGYFTIPLEHIFTYAPSGYLDILANILLLMFMQQALYAQRH